MSIKENDYIIFLGTKLVTRGQSPPKLIVSTVKCILQRLLWVYEQRIYCTDLAMLYSPVVRLKSEHYSW